MSIAKKAFLIVAVPVLFEVVFLIMFINAERRSTQYRTWQARSTESAMSAGRLLGLVNDAQSSARGFAITGNRSLLEAYLRSVEKLPAEVAELERISKITARERKSTAIPHVYSIDDVKKATAAVIAHLQHERALIRAGRHAEAIADIKSDATNSVMDEFRRRARGYQLEELANQREQHAELERLARARHIVAVAVVIANAAIALSLIWYLQRHLKRRLQLMLQNMSRFAAGKALHVPAGNTDEIGRLDADFHAMALQLDAARHDLQARNEELARMNTEKNHFMGMAAHDLRNPLFSVLLSAEALVRRSCLSGEDQERLQQIKRTVKEMTNLVNDFLDVSLIEAGELRLRRAPADVAAIARECVASHGFLAEQKQIDLRLHAGESVPANVDRDKIAQVIANLITNAVKFSAAGTSVDVLVERDRAAVRVSVVDHGQGIAADEMDRLFAPFSRTSAKATAGETSTGLGLAISRKIIEGHGGRIWTESEAGKGSTFSFQLDAMSDS
jgi:signal transduction histidine kinase